MITKYIHYNKTKQNSSIVELIESALLLSVNLIDLKNKNGKQKSSCVAKIIEASAHSQNIFINIIVEHTFINGQKDAIDIYIKHNDIVLIVEIDNLRADQVAKKILSRTSAFEKQDVIYITFCYDSNSAKGHKDECLKYMDVHFRNYFSNIIKIEYLAFVPTKYV